MPDGVGGTIKRLADRLVLRGNDIPSATAMYNILKINTSIALYLISQEDIDIITQDLSQYKLSAVPGTMKIHQVICRNGNSIIHHRELSCMCSGEVGNCECFNPVEFKFPTWQPTEVPHLHPDDESYFLAALERLQKSDLFEEIHNSATVIAAELTERDLPVIRSPCTSMKSNMTVDQDSARNMPDDCDSTLMPATVNADGDCLPHTGSIFAVGHQDCPYEMRLRIVLELILNQEKYLDPEYLRLGENMTDHAAARLPNHYTMYSAQYEHISRISTAGVIKTYQNEVMEMTKPSSYMGIWQIFALSSVLGASIISVYPDKGNAAVRQHLNRTILPRKKTNNDVFHVMWTSTRYDEMRSEHFVPNHFVPLLTTQESYLDNHVVVMYDGQPYPGLVVDVDLEDIQVKCMCRIGPNRFFWPARDDVCWYSKDDIIRIIPPPVKVTGRHHQVRPDIWDEI